MIIMFLSFAKAIRLVYTNDGDGLLALGSKGIQKLWKWKPTRLNRSGKVIVYNIRIHACIVFFIPKFMLHIYACDLC